jgi:hypothetical protein
VRANRHHQQLVGFEFPLRGGVNREIAFPVGVFQMRSRALFGK